jgi:hypothetical protein
MSTLINRLAKISFAAAVIAGGLLAAQQANAASVRTEPNGAARFYDDNGYDRGYSWCKSPSGTLRCDYFTLEQCQAASLPNNTCAPNAWSYQVTVPRQRLQLQ